MGSLDWEFIWHESAKSVSLAGTFNDWNPAPLTKVVEEGKEYWRTILTLKPGRYEYKFVIDDTDWKYNPSLPKVENADGAENNVIEVDQFFVKVKEEKELLERKLRAQKIDQAASSQKVIHNALRVLWEERLFSDIELVVNNYARIKCHKAILASASPVFKKMFSEDFHRYEHSITVEETAAIDQFIDFFYNGVVVNAEDPKILSSLLRLAKQFEVSPLINFLASELSKGINEGNCLTYLRLGDFVNSSSKKKFREKCIQIAANNTGAIMRQPEFAKLPWDIVEEILNHPELKIFSDGFFLAAIASWKEANPNPAFKGHIPYMQTSFYKLKPRDVLGSIIVCFFADGTDRYNEMTTYAVNSFLANTPKVHVGLLTQDQLTRDLIMDSIHPSLRYRVICKLKTAASRLENWKFNTQYKLDIQQFAKEEGFETVFWFDSDTINIKDCTNFLTEFANSKSLCYFVPDHVMSNESFKNNWTKNKWDWNLIPQACIMGFKAEIIEYFFGLWKSNWQKWITPSSFAKFPDPNPEFSGSEFCIEQYALGFAVSEFHKKYGKQSIQLFSRQMLVVEASEKAKLPAVIRGANNVLLSFSQFLISFTTPLVNMNRVSLLTVGGKTSIQIQKGSFPDKEFLAKNSLPPGCGAVVDLFGGSVIHCYNHQYDVIKRLWEKKP